MRIIVEVNEQGKVGLKIEGEAKYSEIVGMLEYAKYLLVSGNLQEANQEKEEE